MLLLAFAPLYKRWWFWVIIVVLIIGIAGAASSANNSDQEPGNDVQTESPTAKPEDEGQDEEQDEEQDIPREYQSALNKAESYSEVMHMSKQGIYDQLVSEYGEQFSEEADYAIEHLND